MLPLIGKFFAKRFADQSFVIFDVKRGFGIYYEHTQKTLEQVLKIDKEFLAKPVYNQKEKKPIRRFGKCILGM